MAIIDIKLKTYEQLQFEIMTLITDKYLLQTRIDKAIEYIEKMIKQNKAFYGEQLEINEFNYLLDILKGSDKSE